MTQYGFTKDYLTKDGQPWFPSMGEFHFSRYPRKYWKESIYKMKAGGIDIVSTYIFWIHHEEIEGEYDFSDRRNLREFVETAGNCRMNMFLRIGPWCHGEVRNGGLPDWLLQKDFKPRTNHETYFAEVEKYYSRIAEQVKGLLHKDGGPVIGVQIENEYGHCGGLSGADGEAHMRRLADIARKTGLDAPYYTATGWGGAATGGLLPVMGGYPEAPWDRRLTEIEANENYIFTDERNDYSIGSDFGKGKSVSYDVSRFPFLTAELGGGLQVTLPRRPVARPEDIGAMSLVKLGSGANMLGYYMYHGGTNPKGKLTTLQETREAGDWCDLPVFTYDFAAPIREFGQMSGTLREVKLLTYFVRDFGSLLCQMETVLPPDNPDSPGNLKDLRYCVRRSGRSGYLFVNNYQRRRRMAEHNNISLQAEADGETVVFPPVDIKDRDYFFLPFNMKTGDGELRSALAAPLCILHGGEQDTYIFYTDVNPEYDWIREPQSARVITISREEALKSWKIRCNDNEYLLISNANIIETDIGYEVLSRRNEDILSYPRLPAAPSGYSSAGTDREFCLYQKGADSFPECAVKAGLLKTGEGRKIYEIEITYPEDELNDCFLRVDFEGDQARLYIDGEWEDDWLYTGETWEIGLKRFGFPSVACIEVFALKEDAQVFLEKRPSFENGIACSLGRVAAEAEISSPLFG